jgi:hypothetical protein
MRAPPSHDRSAGSRPQRIQAERSGSDRAVLVVVGAPRFHEWERAGVFSEIWRQGLLDYDEQVGIDWDWLAADGAMTKAPLGGPKTGPNPTDRAKKGRSARFSRRPPVCRSGSPPRPPTATTKRS